jgi:class 3 adenylate cyclase
VKLPIDFIPRRRFQAKLALAFFLLIFVFVTAFVFFAADFYESKERMALEVRAASVASLLGPSLINPLYTLRFDEMRLLLRNALDQPDVLYAYAFDKEGKILADGTGKNPLFNTIPGDSFHRNAVKAQRFLLQYGTESGAMGDRLEVAQPIYLPDDEKLGGVRIGFSLLPMQQRIATAKRYTVFLGAIFALLGAGISALIGRILVRSINSLVQGTQLIASGNLDVRIPIASKDEIGILADSFNHMAASLKQNERLARLKRYLSPQIAASILAGDDDTPFKSHRREITVMFVDLRGFTAFADNAEPEEVMELLREYHAEMGRIIFKFDGTIEHFAGDGIMVFFNDPIPCEDHKERAVRTALEIRARARELRSDWLNKGYDLDVGVGIATGYATLGNIGFEGRVEYGAIGNVPNLSARLCGEAAGGQILTDVKTGNQIETLVETELLGDLQLKGFLRPVSALNVVKLKA